jgi:hypothetical protein
LPSGELSPHGRALIQDWLQNLETSTILDNFAESITSKLEPEFDSLARQYSIRTGQWRPVLYLDPSELIASQDPKLGKDKLGKQEAFTIAIVFICLGLPLAQQMVILGGGATLVARKFLEYRYRAKLERITPRMTVEASRLFDAMVTQAIGRAVTDSLESVRALILDTRRQQARTR